MYLGVCMFPFWRSRYLMYSVIGGSLPPKDYLEASARFDKSGFILYDRIAISTIPGSGFFSNATATMVSV
jgi:hypothetical protein